MLESKRMSVSGKQANTNFTNYKDVDLEVKRMIIGKVTSDSGGPAFQEDSTDSPHLVKVSLAVVPKWPASAETVLGFGFLSFWLRKCSG